ncbi:MAG: DUF1501 domain-containing protein [Fimbriimonadaceae bacterium]
MDHGITRRDFLRRTGGVAVGLAAPGWLGAFARGESLRAAQGRKAASNRVLVVCQLSGGNDGLNTLIPYRDPRYAPLRPSLALPAERVLDLDGSIGLHPALEPLLGLFREGRAAAVQRVGYPNPNRSHFRSMEIWHTADPERPRRDGWLGRYVAQLAERGQASVASAVGLTTELSLALSSPSASVPCFASLEEVARFGGDPEVEALVRRAQTGGKADPAIRRATEGALDAAALLRSRLAGVALKEEFGNDPFGSALSQAARLVLAMPETRVVYVAVGGFDTHARQAESHERLLRGLGLALASFDREMRARGLGDRVLVATFSEFGRRAYENASQGTDHGAAGPVLLVGGGLRPGLHGPAPNLGELSDGDVPFSVDFRDVYAELLSGWLSADPAPILGPSRRPAGFLKD